MVTVFADLTCPFTHVGLRRLVVRRDEIKSRTRFLVLAWPLEWVNGEPLDPEFAATEIAALRTEVAPDLFRGFDPRTFPCTTLPGLALASLGYTVDLATGESVSRALRDAVFEQGLDIANPTVLSAIASAHGLDVRDADPEAVRAEYEEGRRRAVVGSPYFIVDGVGYFCPSLDITHVGDEFSIRFDAPAFEDFTARALGDADGALR